MKLPGFWTLAPAVAGVVSAVVAVLSFFGPSMSGAKSTDIAGNLECGAALPEDISQEISDKARDYFIELTDERFAILIWGEGLPSDSSTSSAQRRLTALRAAELDAKRRMTEWLGGSAFAFDGQTSAFVQLEDRIRSSFDGVTPPAQRLHSAFDENSGVGSVLLGITCLRFQA